MKKLEELCPDFKITEEKYPFNYTCKRIEYCDYKTSVNSQSVCVKYMYIKFEREDGKEIKKI